MFELCQNPICLAYRELLFEREQLPQVVDNKHFRIELIEFLEQVIVLRNQQVAGPTAVGGSRRLCQIPIICFHLCPLNPGLYIVARRSRSALASRFIFNFHLRIPLNIFDGSPALPCTATSA